MVENGAAKFDTIDYDHRNLPVRVIIETPGVDTLNIFYRYNADGQRIYKKVGAQSAEHYILDGDQTVAVYENGVVEYWNLLGNGVVGRYEPGSGDKLYYLKDHLGSTRVVVDAAGNVKEALDYYPFGLLMPERIYQSGSETKEKFVGKELDSETGWYHLGARPYMAALGRFPVIDPLYSQYPSHSPYNYALNNPVQLVDPTGKQAENPDEEKHVEQKKAEDPYFSGNPGSILTQMMQDVLSSAKSTPSYVAQQTKTTAKSAKKLAVGVAEESVQATEVISDAISSGTTVGAIAGTAGIVTGLVTKNPALAAGATEFTGAMLTLGTAADVTSTVAKTTEALAFGGSSEEAISQAAKTLLNIGVCRTIRGLGGRLITRTGLSISGPIFRSSVSGRFVSNTYGFTVTAATDATTVATSIIINELMKK